MSRRGWILFLALSVMWGLPYFFIKVAVEDLSAPMVVFTRCALAAALLIPVAAARGALRPLRPFVGWIVVFAVIEMAIPFLMISWAEAQITSSLAALIVAGVPLVTAVLSRSLGLDPGFTGWRVVGLVVGLTGVAALVGLDVRGGQWLAVAAMAVAVLGYSFGPIIASVKLAAAPNVGVVAVAFTVAALVMAPFAWLQRPVAPVGASAWWSVVLLGVVCSAAAFLVFFAAIDEIGPARTTVNTYLNPAVATVLGVALLAEPVTLGILIGFPLVILGSVLATRRGPVMEAEPHP